MLYTVFLYRGGQIFVILRTFAAWPRLLAHMFTAWPKLLEIKDVFSGKKKLEQLFKNYHITRFKQLK